MSDTVLFISDLHLSPRRPAMLALFEAFLAGPARRARRLYVLGDLFDYWVGDDMAGLDPAYGRVQAALAALAGAGTAVAVCRGNRDFLLGADFARAAGATLLGEETVIDLHGRRTLLMHGDSLCSDDLGHQAWRRQVLDPAWQAEFLALDLGERVARAQSLRSRSETRKRQLPSAIMDVTPETVAACMRRHRVDRLVHGHTHRPACHRFRLDGAPAERWVLGDWYSRGSVLVCTPAGWTLETLPPGPAAQPPRISAGV